MAKEDLRYGGHTTVPTDVAVCPECGGELQAKCLEWDAETGVPTSTGLEIDCIANDRDIAEAGMRKDGTWFHEVWHDYYQSVWQDVIDRVVAWCGARRD